jgi:hypothetical protein
MACLGPRCQHSVVGLSRAPGRSAGDTRARRRTVPLGGAGTGTGTGLAEPDADAAFAKAIISSAAVRIQKESPDAR